MSVVVNRKSLAPSELVILGESDPVAIEAVQNTLSALWRTASEKVQDTRQSALALACLWNLVAFHANPKRPRGDSGGEAHRIEQLLEEVTVSVPGRVIHLEEWRNEPPPPKGKEVEAWVRTHCLHGKSGAAMVCCETINVAGYGEQGHSHFPALVRALMVPNLPMALLWLDDLPRRGRMLGQLLRMSERLIVDSQHTTDPTSLLAVNDVMKSAAGKVVDLGWLRLRPLRHLVAECFDPPRRAAQLADMKRIRIETSPRGRNTGLLLLGWLLSACGCGQVRAVDLGPEAPEWRWNVKRKDDDGTFPLDFSVREGYGGLDEVFLIELQAGDDTFTLQDVDPEHMSVQGPDRQIPSVALRESDDPELVVAALASRQADPVFTRALATAAALVESEQWNQ